MENTRRSRRRSALKNQETADGEAGHLGGKKRVSFSTDLTEVRNFRAQLRNSDLDLAYGEKAQQDTVPLLPINTNQQLANETVYNPPVDELTVNLDTLDQTGLHFATTAKFSSTPSVKAYKRPSALAKPAASKEQPSGWINKDGHLYESLSNARALGERRKDLTRVVLSSAEQTDYNQVDMDVTYGVIDSRGSDDDMWVTGVTGLSLDNNKTTTSDYMDMTNVTKAGKKHRRNKRRKVAKDSAMVMSERSQEESVSADPTMELHRRDTSHMSMLPPPIEHGSIIRPKATAEGSNDSISRVKVERKEQIRLVEEEDSDELVLSAGEYLSMSADDSSNTPLAPVLTAKFTASRLDFSTKLPVMSGDVMGQSELTMSSMQPSLALEITSNTPQIARPPEDSPEANSLVIDDSVKPSQEAIDAEDRKIAELKIMLDEYAAKLSLQQAIDKTRKAIDAQLKKRGTVQRKFEKTTEKFNEALARSEQNFKSDKEFFGVQAKLAAMEKLSLWTFEPTPKKLEIMTFKFAVGVEFQIAELRLTVTVDSPSKMIILDYDAGLYDMLTGGSMPSYRLELLKRLLQLTCDECNSLMKTGAVRQLLDRITSLVCKTNSLLEEVERCFIKLGWFEFTTDKVVYRVTKDCNWACYFIIHDLDLMNYPQNQLTFTYAPHLGSVPDTISGLHDCLNKIAVGESYLTRCVSAICNAMRLE